ncbi:MAG TPA: beta-propeller fold lactonase family protein, partial [Blastocatellia bacterium]
MAGLLLSIIISAAMIAGAMFPALPRAADRDYLVYVVCESADKIAVVRFGPAGGRVDQIIETGAMPTDIDGPHGIVFSPDRKFYYVSLGHGRPFGAVWKYSSEDNKVLGKATLGMFPATMDVTPDGNFLYVVNFNLHGDMVPSSVSIVATEVMMEVARVPSCVMPHGSRIDAKNGKQYSACMMNDMLVEIDTNTLRASRHFILTKGKEMGMPGPPSSHSMPQTQSHDMSGHGSEPPKPGDVSCSPTWAQPSSDGNSVFVACNKSDEIVEIDLGTWKVKRRLPARPGVYNLAVTKDGRLIATNKRDQSVSIYDVKSGQELARLATKRKVPHGAVVSSDDRYAFISVEG